MTTRKTSPASTPVVALLLAFLLIATACGSDVAQSSAERAQGPSGIAAPTEHDSPQFGSSLEEWGDAVQDPDASTDADAMAENGANTGDSGDSTLSASGVATIEWDDLIPPGQSGMEIMARYEERLDEVEVGSVEANALYAEMQAEFDPNAVNPELEGQRIRLAGFVAPLTYVDDIVTEFLLVPTFGACIHVPPPPPNQTIMVTVDKADGLTVEESWGPVWVEGTITVSTVTTDLATTSYEITNATSGVYDEF